MNFLKKEFGKRVKFYREKNNLTQEELAERISLNFRSLSLVERGKNFVTAETLEKLCLELKIKPKMLFDFDYASADENEEDIKKLVEVLVKDNSEKLSLVYKIIKACLE